MCKKKEKEGMFLHDCSNNRNVKTEIKNNFLYIIHRIAKPDLTILSK